MEDGFELRKIEGKGEGVFALRGFLVGETVMIGKIEKRLKKNNSHASQIGKNQYAQHSGLRAKVNHSCEPNCGIRVNETGGYDFVAIKNIHINEEITYDYAMENYSVDYFPSKCLCGSKVCRQKVTGWKDLPEARKRDYEGFFAPYLYKLDAEMI